MEGKDLRKAGLKVTLPRLKILQIPSVAARVTCPLRTSTAAFSNRTRHRSCDGLSGAHSV